MSSFSTEGIDAILGRWRVEVKGKQRRSYTFEEQADMKLKDLKGKIYTHLTPVDGWMMRQAYFRKLGEYDYIDEDWKPIKIGEHWGGNDVSCFFKQTITVPKEMKGKKVVLLLYLGGDSLVYVNGVPHQGLDPFRNIVPISLCAEGGETLDLWIESYYMWHFGESEIKKLECSHLAVVDDEIEEAYWDYRALYNGIFMIDIDPRLYSFLGDVVTEAIQYIDPYISDPVEFKKKLRKGTEFIKQKISESGAYSLPGKLHLSGNSHLDIVFLWPYREFVRKLGRTHASALRLMEEFPDFIFSQSQPAMYKEMKTHYPAIYEQVKERVKEGRWEVIGGMWVEPDCNLISGESFVRQLLYGTRFIQQEFGITPRTCWLPDVFGNCYTMPQILAKSGIEYFVTHKMVTWNDTNPWKTNTFWWEGPDGSRVFGVVPPSHFIGTVEPDNLLMNWNNYNDRENVGESLYCYGWGDGGGGVDAEMLQYVKRYANFPGLPETKPAKIEDALDSMKEKAKDIPVWKDELYLEAHRGVHTTKAELKKRNRYSEILYRNAELFSSIASSMGFNYPQEAINDGWEKILTNQFHDSLPGSHINEVYYDLLEEYDSIIETGEKARDDAVKFISDKIGVQANLGEPFAVFNSLAHEVTTLAYMPVPALENFKIVDGNGNTAKHQITEKLNGEKQVVFVAENVPSVGYKLYYVAKSSDAVRVSNVPNKFFDIEFNNEGEIVSLFDKLANRQVIKSGGKGNVFKLYEDIPSKHEAWDIVISYLDRELEMEEGMVSELENGPLFHSYLITKKLFDSAIRQKVIVYNDIPRIDFETEIDWVERRKLLKVGFDVDVMSKGFTSDIAFGNIERPNYRYNSFDKAKFEVAAHQWIDMSEVGYGVSILNDCKYGFEVTEQTMIVTLLKGSTNPDPEADKGIHYFTYSLYPHTGDWRESETIERALELNNPLRPVSVSGKGNVLGEAVSFMGISEKNVTLEAVKKAEDSNEIIVRVVERHGKRTNATVAMFGEIDSVSECNLLETKESEMTADGKSFGVELNPYEIKTFAVTLV